MGGVDVGNIVGVDYGRDATDKNIHVRLSISRGRRAAHPQGTASATIEGKGLLGDKMIVITVGTSGQAMLPAGSAIPSKSAEDITQMMSRLSNISSQVEKVVDNLERTTSSFSDDNSKAIFATPWLLWRAFWAPSTMATVTSENCCTIPASRPICRTWSRTSSRRRRNSSTRPRA